MKLLDKLLNDLSIHAQDKNFIFKRLYSLLYKKEFYLSVQERVNTTKLTENEINIIINSLKDQSFHPKSIIKTNINKQNPRDLIIEEIICTILKIIFKPILSKHSYGFINNTSCHSALNDIKDNFNNSNWFIKSSWNITNINTNQLIEVLKRRIKDDRFINLIRKFINAGYLSIWNSNLTYSKTLIGTKLGNILIDIYLIDFDNSILSLNFDDLKFVRYQNQWIIGIKGNYKKSKEISKILNNSISLIQPNNDAETLKILKSEKGVEFLEYEILLKNKILLRIPRGKIKEIVFNEKLVKNVAEKNWKPVSRSYLIGLSDLNILQTYNKELYGYYNYYSLAQNVGTIMNQLKYLYESSCLKTFAHKHKISMSKFRKSHSTRKGRWGIKTNNQIIEFYKGFKKKKVNNDPIIDLKPNRND